MRTILRAIFALFALVFLFSLWNSKSPDDSTSSPSQQSDSYIDEPTGARDPSVSARRQDLPSASAETEHKLRVTPNVFGNGAAADGRIYSVALVADTPDIPLQTQLLTQGKLTRFGYAGMVSRPFLVAEDERERDKTLFCAMKPEEGADVMSLYHTGESVRMSGNYMGNLPIAGNPTMPVLSDCHVANAGDDVVRPDDSTQ